MNEPHGGYVDTKLSSFEYNRDLHLAHVRTYDHSSFVIGTTDQLQSSHSIRFPVIHARLWASHGSPPLDSVLPRPNASHIS
jgi:hypothetical protein